MPSIHDSQTSLCRNDDLEDESDTKKRVKEFTKSSAKYILTQIGLVVLVSGYAVAGGFIFQHLESTNEMSECEQGEKQFNEMQNTTVYKMWTIANSFKSAMDKQVRVC
jgi:hypothetical protein